MYGREYEGKTLRFEPSGGLIESALVMQDKETDTYWSVMKGQAIAGELDGTKLDELPVGMKMRWKEWVQLYPETEVLSIEGREDIPRNPYHDYLNSGEGFRDSEVNDKRLPTKEPVFGFKLEGKAYVVPFKKIEGGVVFELEGQSIFLFRPKKSPLYQSTVAYRTRGTFRKRSGVWSHQSPPQSFQEQLGVFRGQRDQEPVRMEGFDTFWYTWSPMHPGSLILK